MRIDDFFEKQPSTDGVISALNAPLWAEPIEGFGKKLADKEEVSCLGMYISDTEGEWDEVLATAYADITDFLSVHDIGGRAYPLRILRTSGLSEGSFTVSVTASDATVYASDPEGARRAVYYLEEEMVKREGAFLPPRRYYAHSEDQKAHNARFSLPHEPSAEMGRRAAGRSGLLSR